VILYLAACGVGNLMIVDFDDVDVSNLHRQVIHHSNDVGINKAESAARAVFDLNPTIRCEILKIPLTSENALELVAKHDVVVDASDNPLTRYLINDACVLSGTPLVSGSAIGTEGQLTVYNYQGGPCYRCLYPKIDAKEGSKSCSDSGVLGPVPGLIGVLQSVEVVKVLTGIGYVDQRPAGVNVGDCRVYLTMFCSHQGCHVKSSGDV
jgi:adenylyltransferase and sulfurtransferase